MGAWLSVWTCVCILEEIIKVIEDRDEQEHAAYPS